MKLNLEDEYGQKVSIEDPDASTLEDCTRVFFRAMRALTFIVPDEYEQFINGYENKREEMFKKIAEKVAQKSSE